MAGLPEVIGLLYRADWARLSLSAEVRFEQDGDLARRREVAVRAESMRRMGFRPGSPGMPDMEQEPDAERGGYHRWHAALLIAPGRRYRLEYEGDHGGQADGSDGEQAWTLRPPDAAPLPPLGFEVVSGLPVPALFRPAGLLAGFTLDVGGPVTACGREAIAVTAVPRHGAVGSGTSLRPPACNRVELIVDAETGILLRREETFQGQLLTLTELTTVTMSPPEADDPARFAPPAGSRPVRDPEDAPGRSGLGWQVAANAAGLAAGGLGAWLRLAPHLPGHRPAAEASFLAAMPSPEPGPLDPGDGPLPSDDLLGLLYRSGQYDGDDPQVRGAAVRRWNDAKAVLGQVPGTFRAAGHGGVGYLLDTVARNETVTLSAGQLRIGGPELYYLDYSSWQGRPGPLVIACDGEQYWRDPRERGPGGAGAADDGRVREHGRLVLAARRAAVRRRGDHLPRPPRLPPAGDPRRRCGARGTDDVLPGRRDRGRGDRLPAPADRVRRRRPRGMVGTGRRHHGARRYR